MKPRPEKDAPLGVAESQLPPLGGLNLDHVAHFVPDMEAASRALEELGFVLTPLSPQTTKDANGAAVPAGTANRCVMLESGYLEFLTPTADTPIAEQIRKALSRHTGQHLIAFGTPAAEEEHARLERHGFEPLPLVNLQREVDVAGEQKLARFSVVRVKPDTMPEGRVQFVQQHTPECLWQPKYVRHPNGVTALTATFVAARGVEAVAARFAQFSALLPNPVRGFVQMQTTRGSVFVGSETACKALFGEDPPDAPAMAGYALECNDAQGLKARLLDAGCTVTEPSPDLFAANLPAAIGGAWLFGTKAAYEDWLAPICG